MNDRRILDRVFLFLGVSASCASAASAGGRELLVTTILAQPASSTSSPSSSAAYSSAAPATAFSSSKVSSSAAASSAAQASAFEDAFRRRMTGAYAADFGAFETGNSAPIATDAPSPHADALANPIAKDALSAEPAYDPGLPAVSSRDDSEHYETPQHPALSDKFFIGLGGFYTSSTTEARLDSPSGIGTTIGFEDLLGLDNSKLVPQGIARWRMSDRWRLELEYFQLDRSNSKQLGEDINWGDQTFLGGTVIDTKFDVSVYRLSAGYSFFKTPDKEFGVALGFHITDIDVSLSSGGANEDSGKLLAPLPVLSLYGLVALTDQVALSGRLDAFRLEYDPYKGHIYSIGLDMLYQPWRHVGMGLGWRSLEMEFSASNNDWEGAVRSIFQGPIAFISASF